MTICIYCLD